MVCPLGYMSVSECFLAFARLARLEDRETPDPTINHAAFLKKSAQITRHDDAPTEALLTLLRENHAATRLAGAGGDLQIVPFEMLGSRLCNGRLTPANFDPLTGRAGWCRVYPLHGAMMEDWLSGNLPFIALSLGLVPSDQFAMFKDYWLVLDIE